MNALTLKTKMENLEKQNIRAKAIKKIWIYIIYVLKNKLDFKNEYTKVKICSPICFSIIFNWLKN